MSNFGITSDVEKEHMRDLKLDPDAPLCPKLVLRGTGGNRGLSSQFQRVMQNAGSTPNAELRRKANAGNSAHLGFTV